MGKDVVKISVAYSDGTEKEIEHGCVVDLAEHNPEIRVEMLGVAPADMVRLTYGMVYAVGLMNQTDRLKEMCENYGEAEDEDDCVTE